MQNLDVARQFGHTLKVGYSTEGLGFHFRYESERDFPWTPVVVNWTEWDRLVAWVELQRKEEALKEAQQREG